MGLGLRVWGVGCHVRSLECTVKGFRLGLSLRLAVSVWVVFMLCRGGLKESCPSAKAA